MNRLVHSRRSQAARFVPRDPTRDSANNALDVVPGLGYFYGGSSSGREANTCCASADIALDRENSIGSHPFAAFRRPGRKMCLVIVTGGDITETKVTLE